MDIPYTYIDSNSKLKKALQQLTRPEIEEVAVDFEGDFNRYKYGITLCLVQMFDGEHGYIIDPFAVDMQLMQDFFNGEQKKVMFDPSGDFILLKNSQNMTMQNVVDVQLAAKLLGFEKLSLTTVLHECMGVEIINKKKFQTANWTRRPLDKELLDYAISDVIYLLKLKDMLVERLKEQGKHPIFLKSNRAYEYKDYTQDENKKYLKLKNAKRLQRVNKIYLKHFFETREKIAKERDIPANHIMQNETLLQIAQTPPNTRQEWLTLKGIHGAFPRYVTEFTTAKAKADKAIQNIKVKKIEPTPEEAVPESQA